MRHARALSDYLAESTSPSLESFELAHLNASSNSKKKLIKLLRSNGRENNRSTLAPSIVAFKDRIASKALMHRSVYRASSPRNTVDLP